MGQLSSKTGTDPAANVEISETVPAGKYWRVFGLYFTFTTDANVANRQVELVIDDGTNILFRGSTGATQAAGAAWNYTGTTGVKGQNDARQASDVFLPLPEKLLLGPGFRIRTITASRQVGDNFSAPQILVAEFNSVDEALRSI